MSKLSKFIVIFVLVLMFSYLAGALGFPQIIGSFQHIKVRSIGAAIFTIAFWTLIIVSLTIVAHNFFSEYLIAYYMGILSSFFASITAGRIK